MPFPAITAVNQGCLLMRGGRGLDINRQSLLRNPKVFCRQSLMWTNQNSYVLTFFKLPFGCLTANFGPLSRGQPPSPDVNYCILHFRPEGHREPCSQVLRAPSGVWTGNLLILTTMPFNPPGHSSHQHVKKMYLTYILLWTIGVQQQSKIFSGDYR